MHDFSFKIFCLTVPKNFVGEHFGVSENFWCRTSLWIRGGREEGGSITIFCQKFFVSQCRTQETFCVSENFSYRKSLWIREREEVSKFCVEYFLSHSAENFVDEPFCVSQNFWYRKILWIRGGWGGEGGSIKIFRRKFLSHSAENFRRGILYCCNNFGYRKSLDMGEYHDFPSKFLSHCTEIFHWRTLWCFRKILLSKIFMHRRGGITVLSELFVSQDRNEKLCKGTLLFSGKFLVSKKIYG